MASQPPFKPSLKRSQILDQKLRALDNANLSVDAFELYGMQDPKIVNTDFGGWPDDLKNTRFGHDKKLLMQSMQSEVEDINDPYCLGHADLDGEYIL